MDFLNNFSTSIASFSYDGIIYKSNIPTKYILGIYLSKYPFIKKADLFNDICPIEKYDVKYSEDISDDDKKILSCSTCAKNYALMATLFRENNEPLFSFDKYPEYIKDFMIDASNEAINYKGNKDGYYNNIDYKEEKAKNECVIKKKIIEEENIETNSDELISIYYFKNIGIRHKGNNYHIQFTNENEKLYTKYNYDIHSKINNELCQYKKLLKTIINKWCPYLDLQRVNETYEIVKEIGKDNINAHNMSFSLQKLKESVIEITKLYKVDKMDGIIYEKLLMKLIIDKFNFNFNSKNYDCSLLRAVAPSSNLWASFENVLDVKEECIEKFKESIRVENFKKMTSCISDSKLREIISSHKYDTFDRKQSSLHDEKIKQESIYLDKKYRNYDVKEIDTDDFDNIDNTSITFAKFKKILPYLKKIKIELSSLSLCTIIDHPKSCDEYLKIEKTWSILSNNIDYANKKTYVVNAITPLPNLWEGSTMKNFSSMYQFSYNHNLNKHISGMGMFSDFVKSEYHNMKRIFQTIQNTKKMDLLEKDYCSGHIVSLNNGKTELKKVVSLIIYDINDKKYKINVV